MAGLVQASQDVLTLLSQNGIYMDDLRPDRARPEVWRRFAVGDRGRAVAALGGVRDRSSLAMAAGRMRQDPIFRDAVHHFLRRFDRVFASFEANATDEEVARLGDTRTARAFMLLGRVTGHVRLSGARAGARRPCWQTTRCRRAAETLARRWRVLPTNGNLEI